MSDISKHTVVMTEGWKNGYSDKLFNTKEEADYDWAITVFRRCVDACTTYNDFDLDSFLLLIPKDENLRNAFSILGMYMINYPRT